MTALVTYDPDSPVPPFEQLRSQLSQQVRTGSIRGGSRLPTVRQLAADLGLAKNTIARAYRALEEEGLVVGDRRRGTTVTEQKLTARERNRALTTAAKTYLDQATGIGFTLEEALEAVQSLIPQRLPSVTRDQESSSRRII